MDREIANLSSVEYKILKQSINLIWREKAKANFNEYESGSVHIHNSVGAEDGERTEFEMTATFVANFWVLMLRSSAFSPATVTHALCCIVHYVLCCIMHYVALCTYELHTAALWITWGRRYST